MKMLIDISEEIYNKMRRGEALYPADANVAIFAIEIGTPLSELCTDAISRQAALSHKVYTETEEGWSGYTVDADVIENLPPVTPAEKVGKWEQFGNFWEDKFKCSECGKEQPKILCGERIIGHWSDYCPNCGSYNGGEQNV